MIVILWRNACTHSYPLMLKYCHTRFTCKLHFRPGFAYKSIAYVCPLDTRSTSRFTVNIAGRHYWLHNLVTTKVYFCNVYYYIYWINHFARTSNIYFPTYLRKILKKFNVIWRNIFSDCIMILTLLPLSF